MHSLTFMISSGVDVGPSGAMISPHQGLRSALVVLDDLRRAHFGFVRIAAKFAQTPSLAQQVPAAVEFDIDLVEALLLAIGYRTPGVELLFLGDELLDMRK